MTCSLLCDLLAKRMTDDGQICNVLFFGSLKFRPNLRRRRRPLSCFAKFLTGNSGRSNPHNQARQGQYQHGDSSTTAAVAIVASAR